MQTDKKNDDKSSSWDSQGTGIGDSQLQSTFTSKAFPPPLRPLTFESNNQYFTSICEDDSPVIIEHSDDFDTVNQPKRLWRLVRIVLKCVFSLKFQKSQPIHTDEDLSHSIVEFRSLQIEHKTLKKTVVGTHPSTADNSVLHTFADAYVEDVQEKDELDKAMKRGIRIFDLAQLGTPKALVTIQKIFIDDPT